MPESMIVLPMFECNRCEYTWIPKKVSPKFCPRCRSPYWNKQRVYEKESLREYPKKSDRKTEPKKLGTAVIENKLQKLKSEI